MGIPCLVLALSLSGCESLPSQSSLQDPLEIRLEELESRLAALERILASGSLIDLTVQLDELQRQTAGLRGSVESLGHSTSSIQDRQRDLYGDLDDRIQYLERNMQQPTRQSIPNLGPLAGALLVPGGNDRVNYEAAFELLKEQRFAAAGSGFQQFLAAFPNSQLADNAQYWLAESYYVTDQFDVARREFLLVINRYPRSRKIPDALLKLGYSNYELDRWSDARSALQLVRDDHDESTAARLAVQRLQRMTDEGH
jgi:tol-pal system protein YbgF